MNQELLDAYNDGLHFWQKLDMSEWKAAKNLEGGATGLDLGSTLRLDPKKVEDLFK